MTEIAATYHFDSLPVVELFNRYGIKKSSFYGRAKKLGLTFESRNSQAVANGDQIGQLDALNDYLKTRGNTIATFVESLQTDEPGQITQHDPMTALLVLASAVLQQKRPQFVEQLEGLQRICDQSWLIPSRELATLLGRKTVKGKVIVCYGFKCSRINRSSREWKVERVKTQLD